MEDVDLLYNVAYPRESNKVFISTVMEFNCTPGIVNFQS